MNKKTLSLLILFMYVTVSFSQNELAAYKYIIVPKKYDILKGVEDKYKLNSLTEFLFNKYGFNALFQDEVFPQDLLLNPCLGVVVGLVDDSKLFSTKLKIELRDCYNKVVYTSIEGVSREKEYVRAYQEALRGAFVSFKAMDYEFNPAMVTNSSVVSKTNEPVGSTNAEPQSTVKTEPEADTLSDPVPVPFVVIEDTEVKDESGINATEESEQKEVDVKPEEPVAEVESVPVPVVVPVVVPAETNDEVKSGDNSNSNVSLKSYKNENISFFIIEQEGKLMAYVNNTKLGTYKKGELIGTFVKTSIPNVYRVTWKDKGGEENETTGYFDEAGNLKIDVNRNGEIEIIIFEVEQ